MGRHAVGRALLVAALAAFVLACLWLGWWQFERYRSPGGSWQNLGYTLQWPTFAIFALFAVWRLSRLERQRRAAATRAAEADSPATAAGPPQSTPPASRPRSGPPANAPSPNASPGGGPYADQPDEPDDIDDELAAYNRYLAALHAGDRPGAGGPAGKERKSAR